MADAATVSPPADGRDLVRPERRVVGLEGEDPVPQVGRHPAAVVVGIDVAS